MNIKSMGKLVDYLRSVPEWDGRIDACFDGYIFIEDHEEQLNSDTLYELGFLYDRLNDWYSFEEDRGV